jgi:hypothetical protein
LISNGFVPISFASSYDITAVEVFDTGSEKHCHDTAGLMSSRLAAVFLRGSVLILHADLS